MSTELAWAAGFFDGEGSFRCDGKPEKNNYRLRATLSQTAREPLDRFQRAVAVGVVLGPYDYVGRTPLHRRPQYSYNTNRNEHAVLVARLLWTYLSSPKREQIKKCFQRWRDVRGIIIDTESW